MQRSKLFNALAGVVSVCVSGATSVQAADSIAVGNLQVTNHYDMTSPGGVVEGGPSPFAPYSNVSNFSMRAITQPVVANQAGNDITNMIMDDITPVGGFGGQPINFVTFSVFNGNAVPVGCRPRIRFWNANGAGGGPGTYYGSPANIGFTFGALPGPPVVVNPGVTLLTGNVTGTGFLLPAGRFWAGVTFDNNARAGEDLDPTGMGNGPFMATAAELAMLGQGIFDPVDVGTSANEIFTTTAAGSFFGVANPAGALGQIGGTPVVNANLGWEFEIANVVPEPTSLGLLGLALAGVASRRRKA